MKKFCMLVLLVAAFAALSLGSSRAADETITVTLAPQNGSGESGTAAITRVSDGEVKVTVNLSGGGAALSEPQPIHIHKGTCAQLDPKPTYPLTNVVNGKSETQVTVSIIDLTTEAYAINVHKSAAEASVYVSCGNIQAMTTGTSSAGTGSALPASGNGNLWLLAGDLLLLALVWIGVGLTLRRRRA
jgi:hypothetical protein